MTWVILGSDHYASRWQGKTWHLKRNDPGVKPPWTLYTERQEDGRFVVDQEQGIGATDVEAAQARAELWFETARYVR